MLTKKRAFAGAVVALSLGCFLTACSGQKPDTTAGLPPGLPAYLAGLPWANPQDAEKSADLDRALVIDPCAMQDPASAANATGQPTIAITPGDVISQCDIDTGSDTDGWHVYAAVDTAPDAGQRQNSAPVDIAGLRFYRFFVGSDCHYATILPNTPGAALTLAVQHYGTDTDPPPDTACADAEKYLRSVVPLRHWADPATRADGRSSPALPLGTHSPCATMQEALTTIPPLPGRITPDARHPATVITRNSPARCALTDMIQDPSTGLGTPKTRAQVSYEANDDPARLAANGSWPAATVDGHPAVVIQHGQDGCQLGIQASPTVIDPNLRSPGANTITQNIYVDAPDCATTQRYAELVIRAASA